MYNRTPMHLFAQLCRQFTHPRHPTGHAAPPSFFLGECSHCLHPLSWEMGVLQLDVCLCCSMQTPIPVQGDALWHLRHPSGSLLPTPCCSSPGLPLSLLSPADFWQHQTRFKPLLCHSDS